MGVHGLTTYFKENRRSLSYTLELRCNNVCSNGADEHSEDINIVVDGWSLVYAVFNTSGEPWVYGGENASLARHVETIVASWIRVGIRPTFVFDGSTPSSKYQTLVSRLQDNCVKPANLFFRTSPAARSTPRSLAETRIAPPIAYSAIVATLLSMGDDIRVEFADGEADPYIVALAGRLGAYVTGTDSDFLVLNCEGYKGYIPLDEMTWIASAEEPGIRSPGSSSFSVEDGFEEFQVVTKKKHKGKAKAKESRVELGTGVLPPSLPSPSDLSLLVTVYEPATFAKHVSLPPSLLPLLGALIGNDYASFEFFRTTESVVQRVQRVADTLSLVLKEAQSGNAKKIRKINRGGQGSVMDIIGTTVERLLLWRDPRIPPASGQIDKISETVVHSTLEYAMDGPTSLFLDEDEADSEDLDVPISGVDDPAERVRRLYSDAYHSGAFHSLLIQAFTRGVCFPRLFLEDPDRECCARSIGRPIRQVIWNIFNDGGGIPDRLDPIIESNEQVESLVEDEGELVDVVEEMSDEEISVEDDDEDDPLAALRGKLQRLSFSGGAEVPQAFDISRPDTESETPASYVEVAKPPPRLKTMSEYVRRGARVAREDLEVTGLDGEEAEGSVPIQLRPVEDRLRVFLKALGSDTHRITEIATQESQRGKATLRGGALLLIVALRWVLKTLHARAEASDDGNRRRERNKEKWTRSEAQAFVACLSDEDEVVEAPPIEERAIQLTAQILAALEPCAWLAQALLLVDLPSSHRHSKDSLPMVMGQAEKMFSGRNFHATLARPKQYSSESFKQMWDAVEEGLEDTFGEEKGRRGKKERKERRGAINQNGTAKSSGTSMYAVLDGLEV